MTYFPGRLLASARYMLLAVIFSFTPVALSVTVAQAQVPDLSTDEVTIDLSVIDSPGPAPLAAPFIAFPRAATQRRGLLLPGNKNPVSRLHVAVPKVTGRIKLKKPGRKPKEVAKRVVKKKTRVKQAKITKPTPPIVTVAKPPAPMAATPPAAPVVAPAPPPVTAMPKAKAQQAAKADPKPAKKVAKPVVEKPMAAKVQKPAVKTPLPPKAAPPPAAPPQKPVERAEAKPKPTPDQKEQAALPPGPEATKTGRALRVEFGAKASKVPVSAKKGLQSLAAKLKGKNTLRLQLMAYAGGNSLSASKARRLSLSRALSVRSFLIEKGVRSTRIDVRALGSKTTEKPLNRVDVNIVER